MDSISELPLPPPPEMSPLPEETCVRDAAAEEPAVEAPPAAAVTGYGYEGDAATAASANGYETETQGFCLVGHAKLS